MANFFDQFDPPRPPDPPAPPTPPQGNYFDQFDPPARTPLLDGVNSALAGGQEAVAASPPSGFNRGWDYVDNTGANFFAGARKGVAAVLGAPVDLINAAPMLANFIPGVEGVGPISSNPVGGSGSIDWLLTGGGLLPDAPEPQNAIQRIANRAGFEVGAAAVPVGGVFAKAATTPLSVVQQMATRPTTLGEAFAGSYLHPAVVNPAGTIGREMTYALGAGSGAGIANELAGADQYGDNFWSDFFGSLAGTAATAGASGIIGAGRNAWGAMAGNPGMMDDIAGQEVADRIINNSTLMQEQAAMLGPKNASMLDTGQLAAQLRQPAAIENAVPGYQANIGDRAQDPGLATLAFNTDTNSPGAANSRRVANEGAINERLAGLNPGGDPARFRADLQTAADQTVATALSDADIARLAFEAAAEGVQPQLADATARGSAIRSGLADAYAAAQQGVRDAYAPINEANVPVDIGPLQERFGVITEGLPLNDRARFLPSEAGIPEQLAGESPVVPYNEITSMRGGLTDDIRAQRASGQHNAARVGGLYADAIDDFSAEALPDELIDQLEVARATRRDVADRFERPSTFIGDNLATVEGGGYRTNDAGIAPGAAQPDQGRLSNLRETLREAGADPRVRGALADQVMSEVQERGLLERPAQLQRYLNERKVLLGEFPELQQRIEAAGQAAVDMQNIQQASERKIRDVTTPGRSATASYLKYADESVGQAINSVLTAPKPVEALDELLTAVNRTPEAVQDLQTAFWNEVSRRGAEKAPGITGAQRWNGKRLIAALNDPKISAVAEQLWADNPEELADIRNVFEALAGAEGSTRARAANSSGTAQALSGRFDPSLSAASLASRARGVSRGVISPAVAVVDVAATWLRRRTAQVQARAIDQLAAAVVNNPGLAADLLERYNPANAGAYRRMLTQKYGIRATQILNMLDEEEPEPAANDDIVDIIVRGGAN